MKKIQMDIKVTIVTPSYNQGQFIEETILSVLNQTYKNIQYILVDGGSIDNTMDIVKKYQDRIDIVLHEKDKGQTDAINKGFRLAAGELVGWINSDDILYDDCIEKIVNLYLANQDGAIYYGSKSDFIDENGYVFKLNVHRIPNKTHLLNDNYSIIQQGSFYRLDIVDKCNFLDDKLNYCMDLDLWLKLLDFGSIYSFDEKSLSAFRWWGNTKTLNGGYKFFREIRTTIIKYGAYPFSHNVRLLYWYELKDYVKRLLIILKLEN